MENNQGDLERHLLESDATTLRENVSDQGASNVHNTKELAGKPWYRACFLILISTVFVLVAYFVIWKELVHPFSRSWTRKFTAGSCIEDSVICPSSNDYRLILSSILVSSCLCFVAPLLISNCVTFCSPLKIDTLLIFLSLPIPFLISILIGKEFQSSKTVIFMISSIVGLIFMHILELARCWRFSRSITCAHVIQGSIIYTALAWEVFIGTLLPHNGLHHQASSPYEFLDVKISFLLWITIAIVHGLLIPCRIVSLRYALTLKALLLFSLKYVVLLWSVGLNEQKNGIDGLRSALLVTSVISISELLMAWTCKEHFYLSVGIAADMKYSPEDTATLLSTCTFFWVTPTLLYARNNGKLKPSELPALPLADHPDTLLLNFEKIWRKRFKGRERDMESTQAGRWLMFTLIYSVQPSVFWSSLLTGLSFEACMVIDPILLQQLLSNTQGSDLDLKFCLFLVVCLSLSMFIRVVCMEYSYFTSVRVMNNARTLLATLVFRKGLRVPERSSNYDAGKLKNLMATDADLIGKSEWIVFAAAAWLSGLLSLPIIIYCMYSLVGNAAFVAFVLIFLGSYLSKWFAEKAKPISTRLQEKRDIRSKLLNALLTSIKVIKLQTWEHPWAARIKQSREDELGELVTSRLFSAVQGFLSSITILSIPVGVFAWYTQVNGKVLTSVECFTTLAWIQQMGWSVTWLPAIAGVYSRLMPSCERLAEFFLRGPSVYSADVQHEDDWINIEIGPESGGSALSISFREDDGNDTELFEVAQDPVRIVIDHVSELPEHQQLPDRMAVKVGPNVNLGYNISEPVLSGVDIEIEKGEFVVIVGGVGSGKSTLLGTMAKALETLQGNNYVHVNGSRAFVSQKPFLLNDTVKNNILFGLPFDERHYELCIDDAALRQDLFALHNGDKTLCGENGVQLSGGQKARICLARALYADADVYFFDDVLSAVDATTGAFLWSNTLIEKLKIVGNKTIILVTHQLQYLQKDEISRVIVLHDGRIDLNGPWQRIKTHAKENIKKFVEETSQTDSLECEEDDESQGANTESTSETFNGDDAYNGITIRECISRVREILGVYMGREVNQNMIQSLIQKLRGDKEQVEQRQEGLISWADFKVYLSEFGSNTLLSSMFLVVILSAALSISSNVWLSIWSDPDRDREQSHSQIWYLSIYSGIGLSSAVTVALETVVLTFCALRASRILHQMLVDNVIYAPLSFFDATPSGQIVNRFLQDMANIDQFVPDKVLDQLKKTLTMTTQFALVLYFAPYVLVSLPMIVIPYYYIFKVVRIAARDTRRIEAVAHSPVYTQFQDVISGKACIRAYGAERRFEIWNSVLVEKMGTGRYANEAVNKWAQALSTQLGCVFYLCCGCACVVLAYKGKVSSSQLGLVLLYANQLQRALMDYLMGLASLETNFVSVERIAEYSRLENEEEIFAELCAQDVQVEVHPVPPNTWPIEGSISVKNVSMRYLLHRKLVLNNLSFEIPGGFKVAICGRTGCGKSTTLSILMRLYPISQGRILIDGIDISSFRLHDLRKSIRVVTQDPVLLVGTIRSNIVGEDGDDVTDEDIWEALRQVQLSEKVKALGLDFKIEEGGSNLSVGERQLLCTARAIVRRAGEHPKVLLCDEATANIDLASDEKVHNVLLSENSKSTVVMICHRLQHIHKFDMVIVMGGGKVLEIGSPAELTKDPSSELYKLVNDSGN